MDATFSRLEYPTKILPQ